MIVLALMGCHANIDFFSEDSRAAGTDSGLVDSGIDSISGRISGTVSVELYIEDGDGIRQFIAMEDAYGEDHPYGPVFVTATTPTVDGGLAHHGTHVILDPSVRGDDYSLDIQSPSGVGINVYGALDEDGDGTIHSSDPTGLYPHELELEQGEERTDIDLSILVLYDPDLVGNDHPWSGGEDGGQGCEDVAIQGDVFIDDLGEGQRGVVMLADMAGTGPVDWVWFDAESTGLGGRADYEFSTCRDQGERMLVGAFDTNGNEIVDPDDQWGAWANAEGEDLNPVDVLIDDLEGHDIWIPLGDGSSPLDLVPFVFLAGTVTVYDGSFDELQVGSTVYVAALKYRPDTDLAVRDLESLAYDYDVFEWPELAGQSVKDFHLGVPADTVVYLWAFADEDMDGIVNESGERITSGGSDGEGTYVTGSSDSQQNLPLAYADGSR